MGAETFSKFAMLSVCLPLAISCAHQGAAGSTEASQADAAHSSQPAKQDATLASAKITIPEDVQSVLGNSVLHFAFNDDSLTGDDREKLQRVGDELRKHADIYIDIEGNCDERGTQEYNMALGQRRADNAKSYLAHLGVSVERMNTISWGFNHPVDASHNEQAWSANRRDEMKPRPKG